MAFLYFLLVFAFTWAASVLLNPLWAFVIFLVGMMSFMLYAMHQDDKNNSGQ